MNVRLIDRLVAGFVFLWALVLYLLTVAPTTSFWDSGEFIAIASLLEVSHPPGAPFYMLVGRLFSMFAPEGDVALMVNLVSVISSALTVLLTHLIIVRLVRAWQGAPSTWTVPDRITALAGGVIGALTFAATDSFWFNAVEAEVYAMSMLFTAAVVWLIMKWSDQAVDEEAVLAGREQHPFGLAANRYLVLIAYFFGLAIGVHLLNLLAIFFILLIVFFTEFERPEWTRNKRVTGIVVTGIVSSIVFLFIYPGIVQVLPDLIGSSGAPMFFILGLVAVVVFGLYYTQQRSMQAANLVVLCITVVLIGYSTYALIFIRSAADPPIDENDPETTEAVVSYLKREQYGETPLLRGPSYDDAAGVVNQERLVSFPRRYSPDPNHWRVYAQYDSDWEFFWEYQVGHMYLRYFLWNFVGRASDAQDAPPAVGFASDTDDVLARTPSEKASRNTYFGLPLLLGLIGAAYHFSRDWRRAFSVLILFLVTGFGIIVYLNQTPMQPRERDYSYVASFFAFSLWVGIGATGLLQLVQETIRDRLKSLKAQEGLLLCMAGVLFAAVPLLVTTENYFDHDRSGNYVAPEYAYNMLASLDENAIIFTNGDNDTFPLWYLQEVEGIRQDVRVVNLSLLNTSWYIKQLKNQESRESPPLPISLTNEQIEQLQVIPWQPGEVSIPVDKQQLLGTSEVPISQDLIDDIESPMTWTLEGRPYSSQFNILYIADQVAFDIIRTNAAQGWERPIYFAVTVSPDGQLDLQHYFRLEGQANRVVPIRHDQPLGRVVPSITPESLRLFKFTNLDDPDVYYDENIRRMVDNYRNIFSHTAEQLARQGYEQEALALLDTIMTEVPFDVIPGDLGSFLYMARAYDAAGAQEKAVDIWKMAEPLVLHQAETATSEQQIGTVAQFVQMIRYSYLQACAYDAAAAFNNQLADILNDTTQQTTADALRQRFPCEASGPATDSTVGAVQP